MNTLVLDTGALIALDRNDQFAWATLRDATVLNVDARVVEI